MAINDEMLSYLTQACDNWVLTQILDKFQEGIIAVDADGRIFYVNEMYSRILGVAKDHVLGRQIQRVEPGATILDVVKSGEPVLGKAVQIKSLRRDVVVNIHPIQKDKKIIAAVSIFRDVTETKKLSEALNRAEGLAEYFRNQLEAHDYLLSNSIVGKHPAFLKALLQAMIVAKTDASVLIGGENGVGKEIIAKAIHQNSSRASKPLISVNCAAIPETLLESELFGYEEGSFTGAKRGGKLGKFELAEGGTIFLDEIGDMSPFMQSKLLRVLQEKEIEKIGRTQSIPIDVRVIAATNKPLEQMIKQGQFRTDLYYRLNVVSIKIPPLRERGEDIGLLSQYFLHQNNAKYKKDRTLSAEAIRFLSAYEWPGNVRELQNCIEYAVIMCTEQEIRIEHLPGHISNEAVLQSVSSLSGTLSTMETLRSNRQIEERELIRQALEVCNNNKTQAMKLIGISRRAFYKKLKNYGYM